MIKAMVRESSRGENEDVRYERKGADEEGHSDAEVPFCSLPTVAVVEISV
jgi:hypothetical protein